MRIIRGVGKGQREEVQNKAWHRNQEINQQLIKQHGKYEPNYKFKTLICSKP